ncbi:sporulation-specific protein [Anaeramoeba ignava]|uniref:Sporulation-specific protein n=1 Tax=Anaeramoeba ignava TaxID=1746090 RepID=A0A9Q0L9C2_ANAIG|nr:sporulation-specific protein [Anaeramoeba ignava]
MDYFVGSCGDVLRLDYQNGFGDEVLIATIIKQVLKGLTYLHENGEIHRDIKAGNLLVNHDGIVKIADFGVSANLYENGKICSSHFTCVGTPCWMSPEVISGLSHNKGYNQKADIWSLGITTFELATGSPPFFTLTFPQIIEAIIKKPTPTLSWKFSEPMRNFVQLCLQKDPEKRPTAKKLLSHKFIKQAKKPKYIKSNLLDFLEPLTVRSEKLEEKQMEKIKNLFNLQFLQNLSWNFEDDPNKLDQKSSLKQILSKTQINCDNSLEKNKGNGNSNNDINETFFSENSETESDESSNNSNQNLNDSKNSNDLKDSNQIQPINHPNRSKHNFIIKSIQTDQVSPQKNTSPLQKQSESKIVKVSKNSNYPKNSNVSKNLNFSHDLKDSKTSKNSNDSNDSKNLENSKKLILSKSEKNFKNSKLKNSNQNLKNEMNSKKEENEKNVNILKSAIRKQRNKELAEFLQSVQWEDVKFYDKSNAVNQESSEQPIRSKSEKSLNKLQFFSNQQNQENHPKHKFIIRKLTSEPENKNQIKKESTSKRVKRFVEKEKYQKNTLNTDINFDFPKSFSENSKLFQVNQVK